jgi:beta-glucosidase
MVTLHHFTEPLWFVDRGGFEREENIDLFVAFAQRCLDTFGSRVKYWCTVNEPVGARAALGGVERTWRRRRST